ncbi:hypothetical protein [Microbulbifer thermotolerans]|nr:hypothetical protein [Microbulbifer thermotolerans]
MVFGTMRYFSAVEAIVLIVGVLAYWVIMGWALWLGFEHYFGALGGGVILAVILLVGVTLSILDGLFLKFMPPFESSNNILLSLLLPVGAFIGAVQVWHWHWAVAALFVLPLLASAVNNDAS